MANNRMFIYCGSCKRFLCFAKYYPSSGWYIQAENLEDEMNEFFDEHDRKCWEDDQGFVDGANRYIMCSESDAPGVISFDEMRFLPAGPG